MRHRSCMAQEGWQHRKALGSRVGRKIRLGGMPLAKRHILRSLDLDSAKPGM